MKRRELNLKNLAVKKIQVSQDEVEILSSNEEGNIFNFRNHKNVEISLIGDHQALNASLALMVLDFLKKDYRLDEEKIKEGLKKAKNIGRTECLSKDPLIIIDGSHNLDSVIINLFWALAS